MATNAELQSEKMETARLKLLLDKAGIKHDGVSSKLQEIEKAEDRAIHQMKFIIKKCEAFTGRAMHDIVAGNDEDQLIIGAISRQIKPGGALEGTLRQLMNDLGGMVHRGFDFQGPDEFVKWAIAYIRCGWVA